MNYVKFKKKIISRFSNPDRTIWSDPVNLEPLTMTILLTTKTVPYKKVRKPFELGLNLTVLRTVNGSHGSSHKNLH